MSDELIVREAGPVDAGAIALLLTELNETVGTVGYPPPLDVSPEAVQVSPAQAAARVLRAKGIEKAFIAESGGEPAGFTSLRLIPYLDQDTPYAEITQMHVRPAYRRRGIGAALIEAAEERAAAEGATCVLIITGADNVGAQSFYRAMGYEMPCVEFEKYLSIPSDLEGRVVNA